MKIVRNNAFKLNNHMDMSYNLQFCALAFALSISISIWRIIRRLDKVIQLLEGQQIEVLDKKEVISIEDMQKQLKELEIRHAELEKEKIAQAQKKLGNEQLKSGLG